MGTASEGEANGDERFDHSGNDDLLQASLRVIARSRGYGC